MESSGERVDPVPNSLSELGESPSWDSRHAVLYWVDISRGLVHRYDPGQSAITSRSAGRYVSCVVPRKSGGLAITLQHGFYGFDFETGNLSTLSEVERDLKENRFNDGKCDPAGRFWAGTMDIKEKRASGALYRLEGQDTKTVLKGIRISNGLGWSTDLRTMYFIDTPTRKVSAFDYRLETGEVSNGRTVVDFGGQLGDPDGMAVDEEGMLWVAHWCGYCVTRWNPSTGKLIHRIDVPSSQVTSCCFGGKDLNELFITTAREGVSDTDLARHPDSGSLFVTRVDTRGQRTYMFDG